MTYGQMIIDLKDQLQTNYWFVVVDLTFKNATESQIQLCREIRGNISAALIKLSDLQKSLTNEQRLQEID